MEHFFEKQYKIEFEKFINNSKEYFKLNNLSEGIVSFSLIIDNYNFNNYLDEIIKQFSPSFYLHKPYQNFSILSIGSIKNIFENGQGRFAKVDKNLKSLSNSIYYNWDESDFNKIPLWVGGMKFTVEHDDNIWTDFNDTFWFIPQISFVYENNRTLLIYNINFNIKKNIEKVINDFEQILSNLIKFKKENNKNEISNGTNDFSKILKVEGNSLKDKKKFITKVKTLIDEIENGSIEKVVISRYLDILLSNPPTINYLIKKLMKKNFESNIFLIKNNQSYFFGATPEILLTFHNNKIFTEALAGSIKRGKDEEEDLKLSNELLCSEKDLEEHKIVVEHIISALEPLTENIDYNEFPFIKKFSNIQHLWTPIKAELKNNVSFINLLEQIYPTPAVCGFPKLNSLNLIKKTEEHNRGLYSGLIGWFNHINFSGEFLVGIRSALLKDKKLYAYAGSGIMKNSEPNSEYLETELKLNTIISLFENEN